MTSYFTDREYGPRASTTDIIEKRVWGGLCTLIETRIADGSFGYRFPAQCPDGRGPCGCDETAFQRMLLAEVPQFDWPLTPENDPATHMILDLLEFCARAIGKPVLGTFHSYYDHHHLSWDRDLGLVEFIQDVNLLFRRNGVAYELDRDGRAHRLLPQPISSVLGQMLFQTGDEKTDRLLEAAGRKFLLPSAEDRQDALEKLWDAFERIKTLEVGANKRLQADTLLDRAADSGTPFRQMLSEEAAALTSIGNSYRIRHAETTQEPINSSEHADYLFVRMFAFIRLILRRSGRGG